MGDGPAYVDGAIPTALSREDAELVGRLYLTLQQVAWDEGIDGWVYRPLINCNEHAGQSVLHIHLHLLGGRDMRWAPV